MAYKRFIAVIIAFGLLFTFIVSLFFYIVDPLFYYRDQELYRPQYKATERHQMPGFLRNQTYETLITATSMGRNFRESYVNEVLDTRSFNGSLPASRAKEQAMVAQFALQEQEVIKHIIWEINFYSFAGDPDWIEGPPSPFPTYMYDNSKVNDIRYLFNSYNIDIVRENLKANEEGDERRREIEPLYKFGPTAPAETIDRITRWLGGTEKYEELPDNETMETMLTSFKANVIPLLERYPETKFTFFYAPYPIYNHYMFQLRHPDFLYERLAFKKEVFTILSHYENAEVYDFQADQSITHNIANYMGDGVHYYEFINNKIIDSIALTKPVQSMEEQEQKIEELKAQVLNFDVGTLLNEKETK